MSKLFLWLYGQTVSTVSMGKLFLWLCGQTVSMDLLVDCPNGSVGKLFYESVGKLILLDLWINCVVMVLWAYCFYGSVGKLS